MMSTCATDSGSMKFKRSAFHSRSQREKSTPKIVLSSRRRVPSVEQLEQPKANEPLRKIENDGGNEIIYILPQCRQETRHPAGSTRPVAVDLRTKRAKTHSPTHRSLTLLERLVHSRNIWCFPNIDRIKAEELLKYAEPGNFILRASKTAEAMVLSRCTKHFQHPATAERAVQHHIISVLPRSGYCLTGAKNAHLVFSSVIHLLHFYIRLSRRSGQDSPFLQLPRSIIEAKTMNELDRLNLQGLDFWTNTYMDARQWGLDSNMDYINYVPPPQSSPETPKRRLRPNSVDRRSVALHDDFEQLLHPPVHERRSRETRSNEQTLASTATPRPRARPRASSVSGFNNGRQSFYPYIKEVPLLTDTVSPDTYAWSAAKQPIEFNYSETRPVQLTDRTSLPTTDRFQSVRYTTSKHGIYEGDQSEFWRSVLVKNLPGKSSVEYTPDYQSPSANKHITPHTCITEVNADYSELPCPPPPLYTPTDTVPQTLYSTSEPQQTTVNLWPSRPHRIITGLLSRTLDEHLRSIEAEEHLQSSKTRSTPEQGREVEKFSYALRSHSQTPIPPVMTPTAESQQRTQNYSAGRQESPEPNTSSSNVCSTLGNPGSSDHTSSGVKEPTKQVLEFPTPKTVGRVFVMEAATYSSDDYEFLSETSSARPYVASNQPPNQGTYLSDDERQNSLPSIKGAKLRRSATTREGNRKAPGGSIDHTYRNRYAMLLENWDKRKDLNGDQDSNESARISESETCSQKHKSSDKSITKQTNFQIFFGHHTSSGGQPSPKPRSTKPTSSGSLKQADIEPTLPKQPAVAEYNQEQEKGLCNTENTKTITVLAAPKISGPTELSTNSNPSHLRARRLTADDTEQRESTGELGPSPCTSSRASTVFCPPWDTAPFGGYLSDLITLAGGVNGPIGKKELVYRRRTVSGLDRRYSTDRLSVGNELTPSSTDTKSKAEFQRLLSLWMQTAGGAEVAADAVPGESNATDAVENQRTNIPPPIPRRRSRQGHSQRQSSFAHQMEARTASDISPYAVTSCPQKSSVQKEDERRQNRTPLQDLNSIEPNEGSDVYDEAFCGNDEEVVKRTEPISFIPETVDRILTPQCKLDGTMGGSAPNSTGMGDTPKMANGCRPANYVYAQVIPRHLRNNSGSDSGSEKKQQCDVLMQKPVIPDKPNLTLKLSQARQRRAYVELDEAFYGNGYATTNLGTLVSPTVDKYSHPTHLPSSKSNSSLSDYSSQSSSHSHLGGDTSTISSVLFRSPQSSRKPNNNQTVETKQSGWYIRKFLQRLIKDKNGEVAEQIGLFIDCTRTSSDRGPYRTMQSIRQFINGMTNYLMRNPKLGLSEAVNKEKEQLSEYGFLNVGAILETTLQKYVLRPLHRHVIRQLKREQIRHNELESVRAKIQLARSSPSDCLPPPYGTSHFIPCPTDATVQKVGELFRQMETHYAVSRKMAHLSEIFNLIREEVNSRLSTQGDTQLSSEDYHPVYAWTLARAGILLEPLIPDQLDADQSCSNRAAFCPAALQADYLDGLLTKSQLSNQAIDQCSLNDLFGTLYWVWSRPTQEPPRGSSEEHLVSNVHTFGVELEGSRTPNSDTFPNGSYASTFQQCALLPPTPASMQHPEQFKTVKRRIIPPSRRKTVTTVQHPRASPVESQSGSPITGSKFEHVSRTLMNTLQRAASKQSVRSYTMETEQTVPPARFGDIDQLSARWRPWAPNGFASNLHTVSGNEQPLIRVLVMDEKTNQMRSQFYPVRPSLTASELCNILAFRMKIFDPKEFGLFAHIEGREIPVDDSLRIADFIDTTQAEVVDYQHLAAIRSNTSTPGASKDFPIAPLTPNTPHSQVTPSSPRSISPSGGSIDSTLHRSQKANRIIPCVVTPSWWSNWKRKGAHFSFDRKVSSPNIVHDTTALVGQAPTAIDAGMRVTKSSTKPVMIYRRVSGYFAISDKALSDDNSSI